MNKRNIGKVFSITMDDGSFCYGTVVDDLASVIYDLNSKEEITEPARITASEILFAVMFNLPDKNEKTFKMIGKIKLDERHLRMPIFYHVSPAETQALDYHLEKIKQTMIYKTFENGGLQADGIYQLAHVKERLEDYYAGREPRCVLRDLYPLTISKILRDEQISPADAHARGREMFPSLFQEKPVDHIPRTKKTTTLNKVKKELTFSTWGANLPKKQRALAISAAKKIMHDLVNRLEHLKAAAGESEKLALFKSAIEGFNLLDTVFEDLIGTAEREDINDLINEIASIVDINTRQYGDGEGIANEWRTW